MDSNRYTWTDLKIGLLLSAWLVWSGLGDPDNVYSDLFSNM